MGFSYHLFMCNLPISFSYESIVKIHIYAYVHCVLNLGVEGEMDDENF